MSTLGKQIKIWHFVLTISIKLQMWTIHVAYLATTRQKSSKFQKERAIAYERFCLVAFSLCRREVDCKFLIRSSGSEMTKPRDVFVSSDLIRIRK